MSQPKYHDGDILFAGGQFAYVASNCTMLTHRHTPEAGYLITFTKDDGENRFERLSYDFVEHYFKLAKELSGEMLPIDGWNKTKVIPLQRGYVVKRWNKPTGPVIWAGFYNGDPKMASCDEWMPLNFQETK